MEKKYISLNDDLRKHFGQLVYKISLDGGFTCPTRDGSRGTTGCFYCGETGSHFVAKQPVPIKEQIAAGKIAVAKKYKARKFLAYFQAFTSTYARPEVLKQMFTDAVADPDIVGLSVATRPDCLPEENLDLLAEVMLPRYHWLELGLESGHNKILQAVGRGHTYEEFEATYKKAKARGLRICVHLILGLPGETDDMILAAIKKLVALKVDGLKFHNLHIVKNSVFEAFYNKGKIKLMTLDEYKQLLGKIFQILPKNVVIHRLIGDAPAKYLIAPLWVKQKAKVILELNEYLKYD